jgi:hypothetical protein
MSEPTFNQFWEVLRNYNIEDDVMLTAWAHESCMEACKTIRFSGNRCLSLMEIKALMVKALGLPHGSGWAEVFAAWDRRAR